MKTGEKLEQTEQLADRSPWAQLAESHWVKFAVLALILCWFPLQYMHFASVDDPDVWWHMRTGEWIMQHHAVPHADVFSAPTLGRPWVAYSWLCELLLYAMAQAWDLLGIVAYQVLMCVAVLAAVFVLLREACGRFWPAAGLTLLASMATARNYAPRPGVFSLLFFALLLLVLQRAQLRNAPRMLWLLPPLFILWANLHIQFVYGLFAVGVFAAAPLLERILGRRDDDVLPVLLRWMVLAACAIGTLITPYGVEIYRVIFTYGSQPAQLAVETQPPDPHYWLNWIAFGLAAFAMVSLLRMARVRVQWAALLAWALVFGLRSQRDLWTLVIVSCGIIATALRRQDAEDERLPREHRIALGGTVALLLALGFTCIAPTSRELLQRTARILPLGAVAAIHEHHLQGPIFNDFNWGGFLIYAVPDIPVAMDGRTNVHTAREIERSWDTWNLVPGAQYDPQLASARMVLGEPDRALTQALERDPRYQVVFRDSVAVLLVRR